ncbi:hypothetical protein ABW21_db0201952 [Orbilia brochopaga]|nr:hypothetical protein ABW21_db0201952 [Drechslerella brochopaga]
MADAMDTTEDHSEVPVATNPAMTSTATANLAMTSTAAASDTLMTDRDDLSSLPHNVLEHIAEYLPDADVARLCRASTLLHLIYSKILYRSIDIQVRDRPEHQLLFSAHPPSWYHIHNLTIQEPEDTWVGWTEAFPKLVGLPDQMAIDGAVKAALSDIEKSLLSKIPRGCLKRLRYINCVRRVYIPFDFLTRVSRFSNLTDLELPFTNMDYDLMKIPIDFFPYLRSFVARGVGTDAGLLTVSRIVKDAEISLRQCEINWEPMDPSAPFDAGNRLYWRPRQTVGQFTNDDIYRPLTEYQTLRLLDVHHGAATDDLALLLTGGVVTQIGLHDMTCPEIFSYQRVLSSRVQLVHLTVEMRCDLNCGSNMFKFVDNLLPGLVTFQCSLLPTAYADDQFIRKNKNIYAKRSARIAHHKWWEANATYILDRHKATLKHLIVLVKPEVWMPGFVSTMPWEWAVNMTKPIALDSMSFTWNINIERGLYVGDVPTVEDCPKRMPLISSLETIYIVADRDRQLMTIAPDTEFVAEQIAVQIAECTHGRPRTRFIGIAKSWCTQDMYEVTWKDSSEVSNFYEAVLEKVVADEDERPFARW